MSVPIWFEEVSLVLILEKVLDRCHLKAYKIVTL
jgi:hypothetical protein